MDYKCDIYHHGKHILCLRQYPDLSEEELNHIFDYHLKSKITHMDLSNQENLNDDHLKKLACNPKLLRVDSLDLKNTNVGYSGIVALLKSDTLSSIRYGEAIYYRYYNKAVSIVNVDIDNTRALKEYEERRQKGINTFPLPLRDDFEISYHRYSEKYITETKSGIKEVIVKINEKEIK